MTSRENIIITTITTTKMKSMKKQGRSMLMFVSLLRAKAVPHPRRCRNRESNAFSRHDIHRVLRCPRDQPGKLLPAVLATPSYGDGGSFTTSIACSMHIAALPAICAETLLNASSWPKWNRFVPKVDIDDLSETAAAQLPSALVHQADRSTDFPSRVETRLIMEAPQAGLHTETAVGQDLRYRVR